VPRDLVAKPATTPIDRSCVNGGPFSPYGSCAAVNLTAPKITAVTSPIQTGTVLTSDTGTWRNARAVLSYQRIWLRDGQPISSVGANGLPVSATAAQYAVTAADRGHRLSVRVDAAGDGIVPGSATSTDLLVPSDGTTTTPPPPVPPASDPPKRVAPRLEVVTPARGKPRLVIRVRGSLGAGTGKVLVRAAGGWKRTVALHQGRVVVKVPPAQLKRSKQLVVKYRGDSRYLPAQRQVRLRPVRG
jgi:hypothetical protein